MLKLKQRYSKLQCHTPLRHVCIIILYKNIYERVLVDVNTYSPNFINGDILCFNKMHDATSLPCGYAV